MTSKVQPAANDWTDDVKMTSKCSPLQIIEPLTEKTWGQGCVIFGERKNKERNGETPLRTGKYFEWIIRQLLNSAFVGYEEFCRSRRCYPPRPSAPVDHTLLDLQNSSNPTQLNIAKYCSRTGTITLSSFFYSSFQRNPYLAIPYLFWNIFMLLYTFGLTIFFIAIWHGVSVSAVHASCVVHPLVLFTFFYIRMSNLAKA